MTDPAKAPVSAERAIKISVLFWVICLCVYFMPEASFWERRSPTLILLVIFLFPPLQALNIWRKYFRNKDET